MQRMMASLCIVDIREAMAGAIGFRNRDAQNLMRRVAEERMETFHMGGFEC